VVHPALVLLALAVVATVVVGHPVVPLFFVAFFLWRGGRRLPARRLRGWSP
jgi:hypothetical protein